MAQQAENGRKKLTISYRSHEPIELLKKEKTSQYNHTRRSFIQRLK